MSYQPSPPKPGTQGHQQPPNQAPVEGQAYGASSASSSNGATAQSQYERYVDPMGNQIEKREEVFVDENQRRANIRHRITNITYYVLGVLEVILLLRLFLRLLGANEDSSFVAFLYNLSHIFVVPFNGIFNDQALGRSVFETSTLIAMIVYALLAWGIVTLGKLIFARTGPGAQSISSTRRSRL